MNSEPSPLSFVGKMRVSEYNESKPNPVSLFGLSEQQPIEVTEIADFMDNQ